MWFPISSFVLAGPVACSDSWNWKPRKKEDQSVYQVDLSHFITSGSISSENARWEGKRSVPFEGSVVLDCFGIWWNHRVRRWLLKLSIYKIPQGWVLHGPPARLPRARGLPQIAPSGRADFSPLPNTSHCVIYTNSVPQQTNCRDLQNHLWHPACGTSTALGMVGFAAAHAGWSWEGRACN